MKGRKPKPDELKILDGDPNKNRINQNRPKPPVVRPACPKHLSRRAKVEWRRVIVELEAQNLISKLDRAHLAAYCQAWGRWMEAEEMAAQTGSLIYQAGASTRTITRKNGEVEVIKKGGYPMINPYISIANTAMAQLNKFGTEFGMSPASRTRISTNKQDDPEDEMEQILQEAERLALGGK